MLKREMERLLFLLLACCHLHLFCFVIRLCLDPLCLFLDLYNLLVVILFWSLLL